MGGCLYDILLTVGVFHSQQKQAVVMTLWLRYAADTASRERERGGARDCLSKLALLLTSASLRAVKGLLTWDISCEFEVCLWCGINSKYAVYKCTTEWDGVHKHDGAVVAGTVRYFASELIMADTVRSCSCFIKRNPPEKKHLALGKVSPLLSQNTLCMLLVHL